MKKAQSIKWQSPGSDVVHTIPEHARVTITLTTGEYVEAQVIDGHIYLLGVEKVEKTVEKFSFSIGKVDVNESP